MQPPKQKALNPSAKTLKLFFQAFRLSIEDFILFIFIMSISLHHTYDRTEVKNYILS